MVLPTAAVVGEEKVLRRALFFEELEGRDAIMNVVDMALLRPPSLHHSPPSPHYESSNPPDDAAHPPSRLPPAYIELCDQLAQHVAGTTNGACEEGGSVTDIRTASLSLKEGGLRDGPTFPEPPSSAGLTLPSAPLIKAARPLPKAAEAASDSPDNRGGGAGPDTRRALDERIAQLCDAKYGPFDADRLLAGEVAASVLHHHVAIW